MMKLTCKGRAYRTPNVNFINTVYLYTDYPSYSAWYLTLQCSWPSSIQHKWSLALTYVRSNINYYMYLLIAWKAWLWWLYSLLSCESQNTVSAHEVNVHIQWSWFLTQVMYIATRQDIFWHTTKKRFRDL